MHVIRLKEGALYNVCKEQDCSRDALARRMDVASSTAYRVERGDVEPSPRFIAALMNVTGKPFEELFEVVPATSEPVPA